jgi:signal peptidase II
MPDDEAVVLNAEKSLVANSITRRLGAISTRSLGGLAIFIVVLDQVTKAVVRMMLSLHQSVDIVPGLISFTHVHNTGVAFGFLNAVEIPFKPVLMTGIALAALIAIGMFAMQTTSDEPLTKIGLALVFGGATGNLIDRITLGYVIDFIDVYWGTWHFWAFNVADSAITIGACFLILEMALLNRHVSTSI